MYRWLVYFRDGKMVQIHSMDVRLAADAAELARSDELGLPVQLLPPIIAVSMTTAGVCAHDA